MTGREQFARQMLNEINSCCQVLAPQPQSALQSWDSNIAREPMRLTRIELCSLAQKREQKKTAFLERRLSASTYPKT